MRPKRMSIDWRRMVVVAMWLAVIGAAVTLPFAENLGPSARINYAIVFAIGITVGVTEMMARYQDAPFSPLLSLPGLFYFGINGGATMIAYYLVQIMDTPVPGEGSVKEVWRVLLAGLGAMAFFRSGIFTIPIGNQDVAIGPNLILQILLKALDRAYDRDRAKPRSELVSQIMGGVSLSSARTALPLICFSLMQNVTEEEKERFGSQIKDLASLAVGPLEASFAKLPNDPEVMAHLGLTHAKLGNRAKARELLTRARSLNPRVGGAEVQRVIASLSQQ